MKFLGGVGSLSSIIGGTLNAGIVPMDRLVRSFKAVENGSTVTVPASITDIISLAPPGETIEVDDYVLVFARAEIAQDAASSGAIEMFIQYIGAGAMDMDGVTIDTAFGKHTNVGTGDSIESETLRIFKVTDAGSVAFRLRGLTAGPNGSCQAGEAAIAVLVLRNS